MHHNSHSKLKKGYMEVGADDRMTSRRSMPAGSPRYSSSTLLEAEIETWPEKNQSRQSLSSQKTLRRTSSLCVTNSTLKKNIPVIGITKESQAQYLKKAEGFGEKFLLEKERANAEKVRADDLEKKLQEAINQNSVLESKMKEFEANKKEKPKQSTTSTQTEEPKCSFLNLTGASIPSSFLCCKNEKCTSLRILPEKLIVWGESFISTDKKKVMDQPVILSCGHHYCKNCVGNPSFCSICHESKKIIVENSFTAACDWYWNLLQQSLTTELQTKIGNSLSMSLEVTKSPRKYRQKDTLPQVQYKLCGIGTSCGKTSYWMRLMKKNFESEFPPTIESQYNFSYIYDGEECQLNILDISGQKCDSTLHPEWFSWAEGYVIMYNVHSKNSFDVVPQLYEQLRKIRAEIPIIIVGTQADEETDRVVSMEQGEQLAEKLKCLHWEVSAKSGIDIEESFRGLLQLMRNYRNQKMAFIKQQELKILSFSWVRKQHPLLDNVWRQSHVGKYPPLVQQTPGYQIELGIKQVKSTRPIPFPEIEPSYYQLHFPQKSLHSIFFGGDSKNPLLIIVETEKEKAKSIFRTKEVDELLIIPGNVTFEQLESASHILFPEIPRPLNLQSLDITQASQEIIKFEENLAIKNLKFGVIFCAKGQSTEIDMLHNINSSTDFEEFLSFLGERVSLNTFNGYRGGLHPTKDGEESVFTEWRNFQIMFHVSTLLRYSAEDTQQIQRKRHIGNDICVIIFKEDDSEPFSPVTFKSSVTYNYVVVHKLKNSSPTSYRIACISKDSVPFFQPQLPFEPVFQKNSYFKDFLFSKLINAERATQQVAEFRKMRVRGRLQALNTLSNCILNTTEKESRKSQSFWKFKSKTLRSGSMALQTSSPLLKPSKRGSISMKYSTSLTDIFAKHEEELDIKPNPIYGKTIASFVDSPRNTQNIHRIPTPIGVRPDSKKGTSTTQIKGGERPIAHSSQN